MLKSLPRELPGDQGKAREQYTIFSKHILELVLVTFLFDTLLQQPPFVVVPFRFVLVP